MKSPTSQKPGGDVLLLIKEIFSLHGFGARQKSMVILWYRFTYVSSPLDYLQNTPHILSHIFGSLHRTRQETDVRCQFY